jgi:ABC-2 type transport system permease protein
MTATVPGRAGLAPRARQDRDRVGFGQLLLAEWTKLRSLRSTIWSLAAMVALTLGITGLATALYTGQWDSLPPADRQHLLADPIGLIL